MNSAPKPALLRQPLPRLWVLFLTGCCLSLPGCGPQFRAKTRTAAGSATYSATTNTYVLRGYYAEYLIESADGAPGLVVAALEDGGFRSYQFDRSTADFTDLLVGDPIEIEIENTAAFRRGHALAQVTMRPARIPIRPIAIRKRLSTPKASGARRSALNKKVGEAQLKVAFVYLDYVDAAAAPTNPELAAEVREFVTAPTWGAMNLLTSTDDIYRLPLKTEFPGCADWYSMGHTAIRYVNQTLKRGYSRVVTVIPDKDIGDCYWSGITSSGADYTMPTVGPIVVRTDSARIIAHEIGHTLGLGHSSRPEAGVYGDAFDLMGHGRRFNVAKLMDLGVLRFDRGLIPLQGDGLEFSVYGRTTNLDLSPAPIAYAINNYLVSLTETHGLTIHSRTGRGAIGNEPSSLELARLRPGEIWRSPDQAYQIQMLSWNLNENFATFKFNGEPEDSGGYIGGCLVHSLAGANLALTDRYSDSAYGHLEFSSGIAGAVGDCGDETFVVDLHSADNDLATPPQFEFTLNPLQASGRSLLIPYYRVSSSTAHRIRMTVKHRDLTLVDRIFTLSPYLCSSELQFCRFRESCTLPLEGSLVLDLTGSQPGDLRTGSLVVANPNGGNCAASTTEIALGNDSGTPLEARFRATQIDFGAGLSGLTPIGFELIRKRLFLRPGEAVRLPLGINFTKENLASILRLKLIDKTAGVAESSLSLSASSAWGPPVNSKMIPADHPVHPFQPVPLSQFHVTGVAPPPPPMCRTQVFADGDFLDVDQISIPEDGPLRLKVTSANATAIEYACGDQTWNPLPLDAKGELFLESLGADLNCELRAVRRTSSESLTKPCSPVSRIRVDVILGDRATCTKTPYSTLARYTLDASFRVGDAHHGKVGFYFVLGRAADETWYSFDGTRWKTGLTPLSSKAGPLDRLATMRLFEGQDLQAFSGGQILIGYGIGDSEAAALADLTASQRALVCETLN